MKKITTLLLVCFCIANVQAQLLWKVSGNGLSQPSYIMGTHHLAPLSIKDKIAGMQQALDATTQVYGELDMSGMMKPETMQMMQKLMVTQTDTTFQSLFTPEEYEGINKFCKENLMFDIAMMPKLKPAFISNNMLVVLYMKNIGGFNPQEQLDTYFQNQALTAGKKVGGLETYAFQFDMLYNGTSLQRQAELLLCLYNNQQKYIGMTKELTDLYMAQDLAGMLKLNEAKEGNQCDALPGEDEAMIDNRNKNWATQLPAIMQAAPTFVAVGALHLPGEHGLLNLLKQKGYTVEAVK